MQIRKEMTQPAGKPAGMCQNYIMTKEEALNLAGIIEQAISGDGPENSSGYHEIFRSHVLETECIGLVDVVYEFDDEGNPKYNVYSVANDYEGEPICEPEWDLIDATKRALANLICDLVNVSFRHSELERLLSLTER